MKEGFVKCPLCGRPVFLRPRTGQMVPHWATSSEQGNGFRSLAQRCRGSNRKPGGAEMTEHSDGCSYQSCTCRRGPMTEQEAAERLCALLNEIEEAGHPVWWGRDRNGYEGLYIGSEVFVAEPPCDDEPWEVR